MKTKKVFVYLFMVLTFSSLLFFLFYSNTLKMNSSLGAAVTPIANDDVVLITAAKNMIKEKYVNYSGELILTVKDLEDNKYMTGKEINPLSDQEYSPNVRIISQISNGNISDIFVKNEPFRNAFSCSDVCYINDNNYIKFENEIYQIMKVDSDGYAYITNGRTRNSKVDIIDNKLNSIKNGYDSKIVKNVISLTITDFENSNIIEKDKDLFLNSSTGYKIYNSTSEVITDVEDVESNFMPIIMINNEVTYEMGDGSKFNPYVITE